MGHKEQLARQWAGVIMGSLFYYSGDASIDVNELTHLVYGEPQKVHDSITISHYISHIFRRKHTKSY